MIQSLYEDKQYAVVYKEDGLLVHRTELSNRETTFVVQLARDFYGRKVWPIYRLDRGTSGALLLAFSSEAVSRIATEADTIQKRYIALVRGFTEGEFIIDHPLKPPVDPYLRTQKTQAQEAITAFKSLANTEVNIPYENFPSLRLSLVQLELLTGRRHQIRRHLKWISHPIIGDSTYGKGPLNRQLAEYFGVNRMYLHCEKIEFTNPYTGERIKVDSPLQGAFKTVLEKLDLLHCADESMLNKFSESTL